MPQKGRRASQQLYVLAGRLAQDVSSFTELLKRICVGSMFKKKKGRKNNPFGSETSVWRGVEEKSTRIPFKGVS